jgi:hypothetical protein
MLGYAAHVVGCGELQAAAKDEIRNAAFERMLRCVDEIRLVAQVEVDPRAECLVIPAARYLTEPTANKSRAVMGPGAVAISSAVDAVDQFDPKIRIACI